MDTVHRKPTTAGISSAAQKHDRDTVTLAADDGWISTARGRDTVTISVHQAVDLPHEKFFKAAEQLFREHRGRPHWGKVHYLGAAELAAEYPDTWDCFWRMQTNLDPQGRFLNPWLRRIAGR